MPHKLSSLPYVLSGFLLIVLIPSISPATDIEDAKLKFKEGYELYYQKKYTESSNAFRKAFELNPTWKLWYNIGQAEAAAKRYGLALEAFEKYLAQGGDDVPLALSQEVVTEINRLRVLVSVLEIEGAPDGAQVYVDDFLRATTPIVSEVRISIGIEHIISIKKDGTELFTETVTSGSGARSVVRLPRNELTQKEKSTDGKRNLSSSSEFSAGDSAVRSDRQIRILTILFISSIGLATVTGGLAAGFRLAANDRNAAFDARNKRVVSGEIPPTDPTLVSLKSKVERYDALTLSMVISASVFTVSSVVTGICLARSHRQTRQSVLFSPNGVSIRF